jgi:hypothetical protein
MSSNYTKHNKRNLPRAGFYLLRLSKLVAQAQRQKAKIPRATKEFHRAVLRLPALSKGLVLRAISTRGRRGRRPMICFLAFDLAKDKGRSNSRRVPSIPAKGEGRPPLVARDAGGFIKMVNRSCEAVGLGRSSPCGAHPCFRTRKAMREQRHVSAAGSWRPPTRGLRDI